MQLTARLQKFVEDNCWAVIDDEHPVPAEAVAGQGSRGFEGSGEPRDEGMSLGAPGRQGTDPHRTKRFAAVLEGEKPPKDAATRVVRDADASAIAGEGVPHD
jgi:hypothetical protein